MHGLERDPNNHTSNLQEFIALLRKVVKEQAKEEGVERAFVLYDRLCSNPPNSGTITMDEFENIMTRMGDKLNDDEWQAMKKFCRTDKGGNMDYMDFTRRLLTPKADSQLMKG